MSRPTIVAGARLIALSPAVQDQPALLIRDGRIAAHGTLDGLRREAPDAHVLEFAGATILPGLTDAHIHITEWAVARRQADLASARTIAEAVGLAADFAQHHPDGWLHGRGWNPHHWGGAYPDRTALDAVFPDRPVAFQSHDMHSLWVNTRALEVAGIDASTANPEGGRIVRDEAGTPTGMLLENAAQLVMRVIPQPSEREVEALVVDAQTELHRHGITGIHSFPGVHLIEPRPFPVLQRLREQDRLRLRVLQHIALDELDGALTLGLRSGFGDDWIRIGALKMFLDGALGSRTAWLREPYEGSEDRGVQVLSAEDFRDFVQRAAHGGIASTVHAIGDAAVQLAFEVLTDPAVQVPNLPHRVEHVQCCPPDLQPFAGRANIVSSMQPAHLISDWAAADRHWGAQRARATYAFRSLLDAGATFAFGSDAPVEPVDPRLAFYAAATRCDLDAKPAGGWYPEECIPMAEVLRGYTTGAAIAAGADPLAGTLAIGAPADLAVWSDDPLSLRGPELLQLRVRATIVGGEVVFGD